MTPTDSREQKGMEIAKTKVLTLTQKGWIVPSQSTGGAYLVYKEGMKSVCTCPDYELRQEKCKHLWAIDFYVHKDAQTETVTKGLKLTYSQNWEAYNRAQTSEVILFDRLLKDLVKSIPEPPQFIGRPRLGMKDITYCAIQKVYSQLSSRRAFSLYLASQGRQYIEHAPNFNAINKFLAREDVTPVLEKLLTLSALPLKSVEERFAVDSSGFRTSQFGQYGIEKYGIKKKHKWVKGHILVGVKTGIIVSAKVLEGTSADCPQFEPLVTDAAASGFDLKEITGDMGYLSRKNYETAKAVGATAYIPFKVNSIDKAKGSMVWKKMYHYFQLKREEFLLHYHLRSNVESVFAAIKLKFGDRLKSKTFTAQQNELYCKLIAHNIVTVIHAMYELGIAPQFCSQTDSDAPKEEGESGL